MSNQLGFWGFEDRCAFLSKAGDPLEKIDGVIEWEIFRKPLTKALKRSHCSKGGRPAYDPVMMFKILVLQALYSLSDEQAEYMISDRISFTRFLGLSWSNKAPDAKTIWLFRQLLTDANAIENLFIRFDKYLIKENYAAVGGQIVDSTLVLAPKLLNDAEEKEAIKEGKSANEIWPDKPFRAAQKDTDARWTVKFSTAKIKADGQMHATDIAIPKFGYKDHICIDRRHKFIRKYKVTNAARHDGAQLSNL